MVFPDIDKLFPDAGATCLVGISGWHAAVRGNGSLMSREQTRTDRTGVGSQEPVVSCPQAV